MSETFEYRPKFVDIRVKPNAEAAPRESHERPCDYVGCRHAGLHRAPKGRGHSNEFWHFCVEHAADYNRRWNYFAGMSDGELKDYMAREEVGHRPTWTFRNGRLDRFSSALRGARAGRRSDPFGLFGGEPEARPAPKARRLTRLQVLALEALHLGEDADAAAIRVRYADLVKRWHPDSNGGDRSAEGNLQRVLKAYQTLKAGGFV
jgi:hypothetical protein